jgi:2-keto-4-pentenoate hydratase/2-oxohepta-3-ene-1,7-dioic acid hydratase in catechol pathway
LPKAAWRRRRSRSGSPRPPRPRTAPSNPIQVPKVSQFLDYEAELVAIIGKGGRHISREAAPASVFGYCCGNDATERVWQHRTPQWVLGKSFDTHAPLRPLDHHRR